MYYFDNAATTFPKPESVINEMVQCMQMYCANPGRSGHKMALEAGRKIFAARALAAEFIGAKDPANIVFCSNATTAINMGLKGLLNKGDHVISTTMEHNSVARPLHKLHKEGFIELTLIEADSQGRITADQLEKSIGDHTRLVVTTHASNVTGTILPIEKFAQIARQHGALYMVDASQTLGILPLDVERMQIDLLAAPGHKGLLGPQGTGVLYVRSGLKMKSLFEGGTGSRSEDLNQPEMMPDALESGTANTPGIIGLLAGMTYINEVGLEAIRKHEISLRRRFVEGIESLPNIQIYGVKDDQTVAVVSLNIKGYDSSELTYLLDSEYGICTRSGLHCAPLAHKSIGTLEMGTVRFSFGHFNTKEEVDYGIEAVRQLAARAMV